MGAPSGSWRSHELVWLLLAASLGLAGCDAGGSTERGLGEGEGEGTPGEGEGEGGTAGNRPPVLGRIGDRRLAAGALAVIELTAADPDHDPLRFSVYGALPPGAKFNPSPARLSWTPGFDLLGKSYRVTFAVTDDKSEAMETVQLLVVSPEQANLPPSFVSVGDQTLRVDQPFELQLAATDPEGASLVYSLTGEPPAGAQLSTAGLFRWTPASAQAGQRHALTFVVSDGQASDELLVAFVVDDGSGGLNQAPLLEPIGNRAATVGRRLTLLVRASDPDGDPLRFTIAGSTLPDGATFLPSPTGTGYLFQWTPSPAQDQRSHAVVFEVSDVRPEAAESLTAREEVLITVGEGGGEGEGEGGAEGEGEGGAEGEGEGGGCPVDDGEPNETVAQATELTPDLPATGQICAADLDVWAFSLPAGGEVGLELTFRHAAGDLDLRLLDADGTLIAQSTSSEDVERLGWVAADDGRFFAEVHGYDGAVNAYQLTARVGPGAACPGDAHEPDDAPALACELDGPSGPLIACADDDWLALATGGQPGSWLISLASEHPEQLQLEAFTADGATSLGEGEPGLNGLELFIVDYEGEWLLLRVRGVAGGVEYVVESLPE